MAACSRVVEAFGKKLDAEYVTSREKWERLYETTQTKGTGESHPALSPNDEFANFEIWDKGNLDGSVAKKKEMLEFEYARSGLKNGLLLEKELGTNPYKFGLVGSSDAHTGMAAMEEDNFFGKTAPQEPSAERLTKTFIDNPKTGVKIMDWEVGASGYAAVWATENTRHAIWDAMQRRETYATTGPRMTVRLFGGFDFVAADANASTLAKTGYAKGVPMGGDLRAAPAGKAPTFLVAAMKDSTGANLDRYQIVKGWLDKDGKLHEKVYDVSWSDNRTPDPQDRQASRRGQHRQYRRRLVDQYHRRGRVGRGLDGSGVRCGPAGLLLWPRAGDPDAALDGVRRQALQEHAVARHRDDAAGTRLHVADLVHAELSQALELMPRAQRGASRCLSEASIEANRRFP